MTRPEARRVKAEFKQVRTILHRDWDPIGCGVPLDEYDSYAWSVLEMLHNKASRREIEMHLRWGAEEAISSPVPKERLALVLDKLMALSDE